MFTRIVFSLLIILSVSAHARDWRRDDNILNYLRLNHPHIENAVINKTYDQLRKFEPNRLLIGKDLSFSFHKKTSFHNGILVGARISHVDEVLQFDFSFSDLSFAKMRDADLTECDFRNAKAYKANLSYSTLSCDKILGADFQGAILLGTDLRIGDSVRFATRGLLKNCGAIIDDETKLLNPLAITLRSDSDIKKLLGDDFPSKKITNYLHENESLNRRKLPPSRLQRSQSFPSDVKAK